MIGSQIEAKEYPIKKVFSSDYSFEIPNYQRPYSWKKEQVEELFDDLTYFAFQGDDVDNLKPYFLGSIVLIKEKNIPLSTIVDGQQRLTTLTILLSVIRETVLNEKLKKEITEFIYEKGSSIKGTNDKYRLLLRSRDKEFFTQYVQMENGIQTLPPEPKLSDSQENIKNNTLYLKNRLENYSEDEIHKLAAYIVQKCYLVVVSTPDEESAFRIFSVLNDRGMQLSNADILKAEIIGEIPEREQTEYTRKWEDIEEELGRDNFNTLFADIRMIHRKVKAKDTILKEIREYVKPKERPKEFINEEMVPYSQAFYDIKNACFEASSNAENINRYLKRLNRLDNEDWVPSSIKYIAKWGSKDPKKVLDFLTKLERLAFVSYVLRININGRIEKYGKVLSAIENEDTPALLEESLSLSSEEKKEVVGALKGDVYNSQFCKYLLLCLDENLSDGSAKYDYSVISIEHVLPQNPAQDSEWVKLFPDEEARESLTNCLGNLVLLSRRKNSESRNYDFEKKKSRYFLGKGGTSSFNLTTEVINYEKWTPDVISKRQKSLVNRCRRIWKLK